MDVVEHVARGSRRRGDDVAVAALKYVTGLFPELVETHSEGGEQPLHPDAEVGSRGPQQEVKMVGHDRIGIRFPAAFRDTLNQGLAET